MDDPVIILALATLGLGSSILMSQGRDLDLELAGSLRNHGIIDKDEYSRLISKAKKVEQDHRLGRKILITVWVVTAILAFAQAVRPLLTGS